MSKCETLDLRQILLIRLTQTGVKTTTVSFFFSPTKWAEMDQNKLNVHWLQDCLNMQVIQFASLINKISKQDGYIFNMYQAQNKINELN